MDKSALRFGLMPGRGITVAQWVSHLCSPPVLGTLTMLAATFVVPDAGNWVWLAIYVTTAVLLPVGYLVYLLRRGAIDDIHVPKRADRTRPLLISLSGSLLVWQVMRLGDAPDLLTLLAAASFFQTLFFFFITCTWKISAHSTSAAGLAVFATGFWGTAALPVWLLVLLVGWARLQLRRHTFGQVAGGLLLGSGAMAGALLWWAQ